MSRQPKEIASAPATPRLPSREEEAAAALNATRFSRGARTLLLAGFSLLSVSGLLAAALGAFSGGDKYGGASTRSPLLELLPNSSAFAGVNSLMDLWRLLPSPEAMRSAEKALEERSTIAYALRPRFQTLLYRVAGMGNEQAIPAPNGWLFFRKDLDYVNGKPFLDPAVQADRNRTESASPDSVAAIVEFQRQLASRGIRLLAVPVPVKPCIEAHRFNPAAKRPDVFRQNPSYSTWLKALEDQGVSVLDPTSLLHERARRTGEPQYLRTDTHWTPEAMEAVAKAVARNIQPATSPVAHPHAEGNPVQITAHGDTVALLGLGENQSLIPPETVFIRPVLQNSYSSKPAKEADVLLLGDSFSNIYSFAAMGWGERAGFPERLGEHLGRPVDAIVRNSDGAFATRQTLQKELASGGDRLRDKKVVVWEFAARELAFGNWKSLPLPEAEPPGRSFFCPPTGTKQRVRGVIASAAPVPKAGAVPYKEHIVALHLVKVVLESTEQEAPKECLVYTWSMRDQRQTAAAFLRPGDAVSLELVPWEDVSESLEKFQRSELEEPSILLEPPTWADAVR